ncbi:MAG TPA: hypothetical protein EYQ00_15680 [Dehalococcoidia bacterium]|nr:hypothetical protein [Dehalococcoidia bacterium]
MNRACLESYGSWSNTVLFMWLLRGSLMQAIVRYLSVYGPTEADRELAFRVLPDIMRKSAYACDHIRFAISKRSELTTTMNAGLTVAEFSQLSDFGKLSPLSLEMVLKIWIKAWRWSLSYSSIS